MFLSCLQLQSVQILYQMYSPLLVFLIRNIILEFMDFLSSTAVNPLANLFKRSRTSVFQSTPHKQQQQQKPNANKYEQKRSTRKLIIYRRQSNRKQSESSSQRSISHTHSSQSFDSATLLKSVLIRKDFDIDSKIILNSDKLKLFFDKAVSFELIFRASEHNFSAKEFHRNCDLFTGTIVVCETETGKVVGGYTPLSWSDDFQQTNTYYKIDKNLETFLFSIDRLEKYHLRKFFKNKAICACNIFGPCFGYDLQIGDNTRVMASTVIDFPTNFVLRSSQSTPKRQEVFGTRRQQIKLRQYEVFKVNFIGGPVFIKQRHRKIQQEEVVTHNNSIIQNVVQRFSKIFKSKP